MSAAGNIKEKAINYIKIEKSIFFYKISFIKTRHFKQQIYKIKNKIKKQNKNEREITTNKQKKQLKNP